MRAPPSSRLPPPLLPLSLLLLLLPACGTRPEALTEADAGVEASSIPDAGELPALDAGEGESKERPDAGEPVPPLRILEATLANARVGAPYQALPFRAEGGVPPVRWALRELPTNLSWLSVDPLEGELRGTPQAPVLPAASFDLAATDSAGTEVRLTLKLAVASCTEGDAVTCFKPSPDGCKTGESVCEGGLVSECQPKAPSDDFGHCGDQCGPCNPTGADRCVGGQCKCGERAACAGAAPDCCVEGAVRVCVDTKTNTIHCGGCGRVCPERGINREPYCTGGTCAYKCKQGFTECAPEACTDTSVDVDHCSKCGMSCRNPMRPNVADVTCGQSQCKILRCADGFADCDGSFENGCERNLRADPDHCGACGRGCASANVASRACVDGQCVPQCAPTFADCNIGANDGCECSLPQAQPYCNGGVCTVSQCAPGFGDCTTALGCETQLASDVNHCGACGAVCSLPNASVQCLGGSCRIRECSSDYDNCDKNDANGCETLLGTKANCAFCRNSCPGTTYCKGGECR